MEQVLNAMLKEIELPREAHEAATFDSEGHDEKENSKEWKQHWLLVHSHRDWKKLLY